MDFCSRCRSLKLTRTSGSLPHELFPTFKTLEESAAQTRCPLCWFIAHEIQFLCTDITGSRAWPSSTAHLRSSPVIVADVGLDDQCLQVKCSDLSVPISSSSIPRALQVYTSKHHDPSDTTTGSQRSLNLVKHWLQTCVQDHDDCTRHYTTQPTPLPTRVLDLGSVESDRDPVLLISNGHKSPYVALSYCWGPKEKEFPKTTSANFHLQQEGIPIQSLPKTFRDAIIITKSLGSRYLWIDSLCIIQGSREDWKREASLMRNVYKNALVTISAHGSPDPFAGCFAQRDALTHRPIALPLYNDEGLAYTDTFWSRKIAMPCPQGPLNFRAWTLQEQVLSGRVLAYCEDTVFWFCPTTALWEAEPFREAHIKKESKYSNIKRFVIDYDTRPVSQGRRSATRRIRKAYDAWYELVGDYSCRNITNRKDRMVAISAIAEQMSLVLDDQYVAGLWRKDMVRGLLWESMKGGIDNLQPRRVADEFVAPSWSWASVENGAVFAAFSANLNHGILWPDLYEITPGVDGFKTEDVEELPAGSASGIEILDVQCSPDGETPFGQIESGTIRLKGHLREVTWKPGSNDLYDRALQTKIGTLDWDEFAVPRHGKLILTCLYMVRLIPSGGEVDFLRGSKDMQHFGKCICLGLLPSGLRDDEYRRVGLAKFDYWKWDDEGKKEIFLV